jgi:hypothetical protein
MAQGRSLRPSSNSIWAGTRYVGGPDSCDLAVDGCKSDPTKGCKYSDLNQKEIYIEHQVGSGKYAELFVTIYYHLDKFVGDKGQKTDTPLASGTNLAAGQTIGVVGTTGCSGGLTLIFALSASLT